MNNQKFNYVPEKAEDKNPIKNVLLYDVQAFPTDWGLTPEQVMNIYKGEKLLLYDSSTGQAPKIFDEQLAKEVMVFDMSSSQLDEKRWKELMEKYGK